MFFATRLPMHCSAPPASRISAISFPIPTKSLRGLNSLVIVRTVREKLTCQWTIVVVNVDATLVAEAPKMDRICKA